ncbi:acyl-CoA N-acyltransferase [Phascolomyces articulosus]|uniref:Acyl-CoA N-acyltransferase n=1 Tax=Phascolomyces articulosus TaxID=60185 RepID=A0AAD5JWV6_9FUNG|nr:acyl-CoA N-acyltransferase [Phascolomyces articulosus]
MDIKILQPDVTYAKALSELGARIFADTFGVDNPEEDLEAFLATTYTTEIQTQELTNANMFTFMAFNAEDHPVAFCQLRISEKIYDFIGSTPEESIELQRIYVDKNCAGQGIGKQLLEQAIAKAQALGKKTIWLGVWEFNPKAIKFYEKYGFQKVGTHTFKIGDKLDTDEIMVKQLS